MVVSRLPKLVLVMGLLVLVLAGCGGDNATATPTPTVSAAPWRHQPSLRQRCAICGLTRR